MRNDIAKDVVRHLLSAMSSINDAIHVVMNEGDDEAFQVFRASAAQAMGLISWELLEPIFRAHPELEPTPEGSGDEADETGGSDPEAGHAE